MNIGAKIIQQGLRNLPKIKLSKIHGINPVTIDKTTGETINLPRFCSVEMQTAVKMNQNAVHGIKKAPKFDYPKATPQDLKRLTSNSIKDSYSRVEWTNPKNGKVYNILKEGEDENGNILVRILSSKGAFIKNAKLKPTTIAIADTFENQGSNIPHGLLVKAYAMRNNPFAKYKLYKLQSTDGIQISYNDLIPSLHKIAQDKPQYVSLSIGNEKYANTRTNYEKIKSALKDYFKNPEDLSERDFKTALEDLHKQNIRVLQGSGNMGETSINVTLGDTVEGVGALNKEGKVAQFSASRNSGLTQHYELGEFFPHKVIENGKVIGYNITGKPGCDIDIKTIDNIIKQKQAAIKLKDKQLKAKKDLIQADINSYKEQINTIENKISDEISKLPFENWLENVSKIREKYNKNLSQLRNKIFKLKTNISSLDLKLIDNSNKSIQTTNNILMSLDKPIYGTSYSTPIRSAKLALNDMMEGIL